MLTLACADLAHVLVARGDAQSAADAAALAAAQELALPSAGAAPCEVAAEYATRNAASLESCEPSPESAEVLVEVAVDVGPTLLFGDDRVSHAGARAVFGSG